jgi:RND family efflux transporter MFP subunit
MALWKQFLIAIVLLMLAAAGWVRFVPSARPVLEAWGVAERLGALGILPPVPEAEGGGGAAGGAPRAAPGGAPSGAAQGGGRQGWAGGGPVSVIAAPATLARTEDRAQSIGSGLALRSVEVMPEVAGRIVEIMLRSGERIEAGATIARIESEAEAIALERARLVLDDAVATMERLERLRRTGAAAGVQLREAELALRKAELGLREAEFELDRRVIRAPISGWAGIIPVDAGAQVGPGTLVARIDDRSAILVEFRVPERLVGQVGVGDPVAVEPLAARGTELVGQIRSIDNRVDEKSRTLRVQAEIDNRDDRLRAGMAFLITIARPGREWPAVDPLAIQWGRDGAFVWVARAGKAARLPVRIIERRADLVLVDASFEAGDLVISEGVQGLRPGAEVQPADAPAGAAGE